MVGRWAERLGSRISGWSARVVPDPFVIALALTVVIALIGAYRLSVTGTDGWAAAIKLADGWAAGFSSEKGLAFALQMCLVLVTGHAIALSPPVQRGIQAIARIPSGPRSATVLVAVVSCSAAVVHWGLGVIAGAILAREIARHAPARHLTLHYPLMGAAAYSGMAVWHGGLSGSAPLKVAEAMPAMAGGGSLPLSDTLGSPLNIAITGAMVIVIPLVCALMTPRKSHLCIGADPSALPGIPARQAGSSENFIDRMQSAAGIGHAIGGCGLGLVVYAMLAGKLEPDINSVNMAFLFLGIALQGGLRHYIAAITDGARGAGAIVLQFPFYFGIMGIMKAADLIPWMSGAMIRVANETTFPVLAYYSGAVVNLAIPSGGGQWGVQGELLLDAGAKLGVDPSVTVMAFSYGDAATNMLQPFWALPLLGIMGLKARDIVGYTTVVLMAIVIVTTAGLLALS